MMRCDCVVVLLVLVAATTVGVPNHVDGYDFNESQSLMPTDTSRGFSPDASVSAEVFPGPEEDLTPVGKMLVVKNFFLWTRSNMKNKSYELLDPSAVDSITGSTFRPRTTYIVIHGFLGWGNESWILNLKDKLLGLSDCNVISVDWPAGTAWVPLTYYTVVKRVPKVGIDCAHLISALSNVTGLSAANVHIIGHSLGAHAAGFTGKHLDVRLGRITGLDPAGLKYRGISAKDRLNSTDATYVDVMHTNGCYKFWTPWTDCYGINENLGHSDFWPNGGEHQPGCKASADNGEIGCSHEMAYRYYIESLDYGINSTYFLARPCSNWTVYAAGNCSCGDDAQYMGFFVNRRLSGHFYLTTNPYFPYAREDAVCLPGSKTDPWHIFILAGCGMAGTVCIVLLVAVMGYVINKRRQRPEDCSGLVTEEEEAQPSNCDDDRSLAP